jgi:hypothetical protein
MRRTVSIAVATLVAALAVPASAWAAETLNAYGWSTSKTFYPYVHDGFKDVYRAGIDFYPPANAFDCDLFTYTVEVLNANGTVLRTITTDSIDPDDYPTKIVAWDGRKDDGTLVKAGGYFTIRVSDSGTCYDELATPTVYDESDAVPNVHPVKVTKEVKRTKTTYGYVGASYKSGPCPQRRWNTAWQVNCIRQSSPGYTTWHHTFPRNALVGTRRVQGVYYRDFFYDGNYLAPKFLNDGIKGRVYHFDLKTQPLNKVRVKKIVWAWKVRIHL